MANIRDNGEQRLLLEEDADNKPGYNGDAPSEQQEALAAPNHSNDDDERHVFQFYIFICLSTAFKSFEAGIISSMMADIQKDFDLGYDQEGTVTASPDYGIAPGALLAIWVFRWFSAYGILTTVLWGTAIVSIICAIHPTLPTLLIARAVGGFLWSHAATHFPVWIDRHGPPAQKTIWLAFTNVSLMIGVLSGYIMGGLIRAMDVNLTWVNLYFIEGVLMAVCGAIFALFFEPELFGLTRKEDSPQKHTTTSEPNNGTKSTSEEDLGTVILLLMKSPPFYLAVALTGCISGGIVYSLYFATQVCEARGMTVTTTVQLISTVFITAPAPGIIFGSWIVNNLEDTRTMSSLLVCHWDLPLSY
ncbi:Inherit from euNOG: Major Facilitator superfamily [Seminavis robusta]|uniref:Inherit from euNOG: Major Facilitator superfamily n=1 Tax=Seminavis robusta TaxID=568900 RepID=A0A9N8EHP1_9STRA|nr:Inherit from euNOG: Major Facilitator superfamily [Seminavis robusta]|eukprot:Sro1019_g231990.1 Inherit from euNOG: Major Facilitator superfamily (360) ;mRNA; f:23620-24699